MQTAKAVFVYRKRDVATVPGKLPAPFYVPLEICEVLQRFRRQVHIGQAQVLVVFVGDQVYALAIAAESDCRVEDLLRALRCQLRFLSTGSIYQPQVALVDRDVVFREQRPVVRRPVAHLPATSLILGDPFIAGLVLRVHYLKVQVCVVASRTGIGDAVALVRPRKLAVSRLAVGKQSRTTVGGIHAEDLVPLATTDIFAKQEVLSFLRLVTGIRHSIAEEGELGSGAAGHGDLVYLDGVAETRANQD